MTLTAVHALLQERTHYQQGKEEATAFIYILCSAGVDAKSIGLLSTVGTSRYVCRHARWSELTTWVSFETNKQKIWFKPKQDLFQLCFGLFRETKSKKFRFVSVCFGVLNLYQNKGNKQNCFKTN